MAAFYDYFNEQKYADAVKNVSVWIIAVSCAVYLSRVLTLDQTLFPMFNQTYKMFSGVESQTIEFSFMCFHKMTFTNTMMYDILYFSLQFLDLISTSGKWDQKSIETPIMLKEGYGPKSCHVISRKC